MAESGLSIAPSRTLPTVVAMVVKIMVKNESNSVLSKLVPYFNVCQDPLDIEILYLNAVYDV